MDWPTKSFFFILVKFIWFDMARGSFSRFFLSNSAQISIFAFKGSPTLPPSMRGSLPWGVVPLVVGGKVGHTLGKLSKTFKRILSVKGTPGGTPLTDNHFAKKPFAEPP